MTSFYRICFPRSISEELAEVCETLGGMPKRGDNGEYTYLRILDIANQLRGELFKRGIVIIPNDLDFGQETFASDITGRWYTEVWIETEFIVARNNEELTFVSFGSGRDMDGKALAIAQTSALKAWLKRLGLIFGELDDPEIERAAEQKKTPVSVGKAFPREIGRVGEYQFRAWEAALRTCGKTAGQVETYLSTEFGFEVTSANIASLPSADFEKAMKWLIENGDLVDTMNTNLRSIRAKKNGAQ